MMKFFLLGGFLFYSAFIKGQDNSALFIPDSLRKDAYVVNRNEEYVLTIKSPSKYTLYEKHVYTILSSAASGYADYRTYYDKFCTINSISGRMFNYMGKEIKHTKKVSGEIIAIMTGLVYCWMRDIKKMNSSPLITPIRWNMKKRTITMAQQISRRGGPRKILICLFKAASTQLLHPLVIV